MEPIIGYIKHSLKEWKYNKWYIGLGPYVLFLGIYPFEESEKIFLW